MVPTFKGDPAKCTYCRKGIYPHQHESEAEPEKEKKHRQSAKKTDTGVPKRRGRPRKPETVELFRTCECPVPVIRNS